MTFTDPWVPRFPRMRKHKFDLTSVALTPETLAAQDAAIILTHHSDTDYTMIRQHCPLVIDTRGQYRERPDNVVRA